ncbi:hypothetical protein ACLVWU_01425 [Bdellovibrio sp. HCB290]|uniref:hypothetical protein n=1 Tax=Bdellovibrio sp. HCB290 TaxID=3394356 RepID=UPI0039B44BF1
MSNGLNLLKLFVNSILSKAQAGDCDIFAYLLAETHDSPFFEHYHQLRIPLSALVTPPEEGIEVVTSPVEAGAYYPEEFDAFIKSSGLSAESLSVHTHAVKITKSQLVSVTKGETVEVRVISKNGNFVHNIFLKASPAIMVRIQKGMKK